MKKESFTQRALALTVVLLLGVAGVAIVSTLIHKVNKRYAAPPFSDALTSTNKKHEAH